MGNISKLRETPKKISIKKYYLFNIMNKIKHCYKCEIELNEDNKIKGKNMCMNCNKVVCKERYNQKKNLKTIIVQIKHCNKCNIELNDDNKIKHRLLCKECNSQVYKDYINTKLTNNDNLDIIKLCSMCSIPLDKTNQVNIRPICKNCHNNKCKIYKDKNKSIIVEKNKIYYENNKESVNLKNKNNYYKNKEKYMETKKIWRLENREKINQKANIRFKNNPIARLKKNCRTRIFIALKADKNRSLKLIDCDTDFLKKWLQSNFKEEMTWENYGKYWHVDHVIACANFDLSNDEEIEHCFRWTNLQPLEASINESKQATINRKEIIKHYKKVKEYTTQNNIELKEFDYTKYL
jgi:hypothetical protein